MAQCTVMHGLSDGQGQAALRQWGRRLEAIERLLTPFPESQRSLRLALSADAGICRAIAVLMLPTGTLTATGRSVVADPAEAVDQVAERLMEEVNDHKAMLRRELIFQRRRRRRADLSGVLPLLEDQHSTGDRESFLALLHPALRELSEHGRRELILAQLEGGVLPGDLTVASLLSEVVARAWDQFAERPRDLPLELWLTGLLHAVLDERGADPGTATERVKTADRRIKVESGWEEGSESLWPLAEGLTLASVVAVPASGSAWERASDEDQRAWILSQLRGFPRAQRRAFTLYVLEGWDDQEIAAIQHRAAETVLLDIEGVRDTLIRRLESSGPPGGESREATGTRPHIAW